MQPLIDADVLVYEIGFSGQYKEDGEVIIREWDFVQTLLENKIELICAEVGATQPPILFLTSNSTTISIENRIRRFRGQPEITFTPNFRELIAVQKGYKANRKDSEKPFHYKNMIAHIMGAYICKVANGCEADDLICIEQYGRLKKKDTIICTRDKDLRMCPGWHYGWECGRQASFGPHWVDELGEISLVKNKLTGTGLKFFFSQMLMGDPVDNIPGLPGMGPVGTYKVLEECTTEWELMQAVKKEYLRVYENLLPAKKAFREQANLVWMVRERNEDGSLIFYKPPERKET